MVIRYLGGDTPTGPDWGDVDLPGAWGRSGFGWGDTDLPKFQGGGQGFRPPPVGALAGPGGVPAPVAQPPGASINSSPFSSPHMVNGQPELLPQSGGGFNPLSILGSIPNPWWKSAIAGAGIMAPTPAETGELTPAQLAHGPSDPADLAPPFHQPDHPSTMRYPMWPTPPAPAVPPDVPLPPVRPKAAAPAPAKKRIDPKTVNVGRGAPVANGWVTQDMQDTNPNMPQSRRPQMGMFDLSTLFRKK